MRVSELKCFFSVVEMACAEREVGEVVKEEGEWEVGRNNSCALSLSSLANILTELQVGPMQPLCFLEQRRIPNLCAFSHVFMQKELGHTPYFPQSC